MSGGSPRARRTQRARLAIGGLFATLVCVGATAIALNSGTGDSEGLLPPLPRQQAPDESGPLPSTREHEHENEFDSRPAPGTASLAGPPPSVVRRFARRWANRDFVLTPAIKREMIGLSAGTWASAVFRQARLTLPAIDGVGAEGGLVMMKLSTVAPGSKTALVVTEERLQTPDGALGPPRYEIYLASLGRVSPRGYAITAWEPQR